jgi:uncharacterized phage protein gp47/JayE
MAVTELILQQAEEFIVTAITQAFAAEGDEIDLRPGTPQYDIFVRGYLAVVAQIVDQLQQAQRKVTALSALELTDDELAALGARFGVSRRAGSVAQGTVRIKFNERVAVTLTAEDALVSNGQTYFPAQEVSLTADELTQEPILNYWYVNVPIVAEELGTAGNTGAGAVFTSVRFEGDPTVIELVAVTPISGGLDREDAEAYFARLQAAPVIRNLVSSKSIDTVLMTEFAGIIQRLLVVGHQEPEMQRDRLQVLDPVLGELTVHLGGHTDIYVKTPIQRETVEFTVSPGNFLIDLSDYRAVLKIHSVTIKGNSDVSPFFELQVSEPELRYSAADTVQLFVDPGLSEETIQVDLSYAPAVVDIQTFVNSEEQRIVNSNTLVRYFVPVWLGAIIYVEADDAALEQAFGNIEAYFNGLENGEPVVVSRLTEAIYQGGAVNVLQDYDVIAQIYYNDGTLLERSADEVLTIADDLAKGFSQRVATYINEGISLVPLV